MSTVFNKKFAWEVCCYYACWPVSTLAVSWSPMVGCPRNKQKYISVRTETRSVSRLFWFVSWNQKLKLSVCFGVSKLYQNNWNKQNCFVTNRNNPKFSEKYPNLICFKLCTRREVSPLFEKEQHMTSWHPCYCREGACEIFLKWNAENNRMSIPSEKDCAYLADPLL